MFVYTALGDSITAGEAATSPSRAYPCLVSASLKHMRSSSVMTNVLAEPGWTSEALVNAILQTPAYVLSRSSVISIWVGGDDLANAGMAILNGAPRTVVETALKNYERDLVILVTSIRKVSRARIILCTQYNPFPHSPIATEAIAALNQMTELAASHLKTSLAVVHSWFAGNQPELIAGYRNGKLEDILTSPVLPVHPNNRGHQVIARGLTPILAL